MGKPAARKGAPRWLVSVATTTLFFGAVAAVAPACFGRDCDGDSADWGVRPGEGNMASPEVWESTPFESRWIDFPHKRLLRLQFPPEVANRYPVSILPYISAVERPATSYPDRLPDNFTVGSGNLAKILQGSTGDARILNDSCADYYICVVVDFGPAKVVDAGASDALTDSARDGNGAAANDANAPDTGD